MGCRKRTHGVARHAAVVLAILAILCAPVGVAAQEEEGYDAIRGDNAIMARAMYEEAMAFMREGRHREAADIFERLLDTRWSLRIAYNHAGALVHLGELLRANRLLKKVIVEAEADPTGSAATEQILIIAEVLLDEMVTELGRLVIHIDNHGEDVVVMIDGEVRAWVPDEPIAVDPGRHSVNLRRGRTETEPRQIILGGENPLELTMVLDAAELASADMPESTSLRIQGTAAPTDDASVAIVADSSPEDDDNLLKQWWFWGSAGAVVVGVVVIIAMASGGSSGTTGPPTTDSGVVVTALEMP